jgi:phytoene synthase
MLTLQPIDQSDFAIKKGSKSFSLAALFLPWKSRANVYALYSWCRACDDTIDLIPQPSSSITEDSILGPLRQWTFSEPTLQAMIQSQLVLKEHLNEMLLGMQMDLDHQGYRSLSDLQLYCYRVAGVVGLMMCPLIGVKAPAAKDHAIALGIAMQMTNICRDVFEDAQRGRVYLPLNDLKMNDLKLALAQLNHNPASGAEVIEKLLGLADELYDHGRRGFKYIPLRTCFAISLAARVYQLIGHRLLAASKVDENVYRRRVYVPWLDKVFALGWAFYSTLRSRFESAATWAPKFEQWSCLSPEGERR